MSVLIKDMRFPNYCSDCEFSKPCGNSGTYCSRHPEKDDVKYGECKPDWCPLVEVPAHGRLGDLDELYNHLNEWYLTHENGFSETEKIYIRAMLSGVKDSPTVIPASEEEKEGY